MLSSGESDEQQIKSIFTGKKDKILSLLLCADFRHFSKRSVVLFME